MVSQPQLKDEEEEEEVDEIDDVSLLAAAFCSESQEEGDDSSLLAADEKVDYLEGMTSEMFGLDDDFEICDRDNHNKEEEVEALPDAHYGLIGRSKDLLQPQGCIDDLPVEVLRQVLGYIPAQDLYRSISLVCHHWRSIVQDTKVKQNTICTEVHLHIHSNLTRACPEVICHIFMSALDKITLVKTRLLAHSITHFDT